MISSNFKLTILNPKIAVFIFQKYLKCEHNYLLIHHILSVIDLIRLKLFIKERKDSIIYDFNHI